MHALCSDVQHLIERFAGLSRDRGRIHYQTEVSTDLGHGHGTEY